MSKFGENLKELRQYKNLTIVQLSEKTGLSSTAISDWENGKKEPKMTSLIALAQFFDVTIDYLVGIEK